jgi:hypothetical protein
MSLNVSSTHTRSQHNPFAPSAKPASLNVEGSLKSGTAKPAKAAVVLPTDDRLTRLESAVKGLLKVAITEESRSHLKQFT